MLRHSRVTLALCAGVVVACVDASKREPQWFAAWAAAHNIAEVIPSLENTSFRMIVRPSIGGEALRIKLENTRSGTPVTFSAAYIGVADTGAAIVSGTNKPLTFAGAATLTLAPSEGVWSDPLAFDVKTLQRLAVSVDVASASDVSMHALGLVTNYSARGRHAAEPSAHGFTPISPIVPGGTILEFPFYWLAGVDVLSSSAAGAVVAIGDSWIDGRCSTTDNKVVKADLYQRLVDVLAARLASEPAPRSVANAGIGGNRIIPGGGNGPATFDRLDRDVLDRAGVTHVLYLQGMNDLGGGASAAQVTAGMQQVIDRVHARGIAIIGGTLFAIARPDLVGWTATYDEKRVAVNKWIRTQAKFDAVIDFDSLMSGGPAYAGSASLRPEFACDDNVHPNALGHRAMGAFVDIALFKTTKK